jgi:hypothetical protein
MVIKTVDAKNSFIFELTALLGNENVEYDRKYEHSHSTHQEENK